MITCLRILFVISFSYLASLCFGQYTLSGTIKTTTTTEILSYANVMILHPKDSSILAFGISDDTGEYRIENIGIDSCLIHATMLGYIAAYFPYNFTQRAVPHRFDISLNQSKEVLEEITVEAFETGIIINGDTTTYSPEVFSSGREEKLEDILKNLPGINVDEDGKITANGKEVDKLLVEGDDFMNSTRSSLLKGMTAQDLGTVELIRNYQEHGDASLNTETGKTGKTALNIKLSKDAKAKVKGNGSFGFGIGNTYDTNLSLYYINSRVKIFGRVFSDNTGFNNLNSRDVLSLNGGLMEYTNGPPVAALTLSPILYGRTSFKNRRTHFASQNMSFKPNETFKLLLSGFMYRIDGTSETRSTERIPNLDQTNSQEQIRQYKPQSGGLRAAITYNPNTKSQLRYTVGSMIQSDQDDESITQLYQSIESENEKEENQKNLSHSQQFSFISQLSKNQLFQFQAGYSYLNQNTDSDFTTTDGYFPFIQTSIQDIRFLNTIRSHSSSLLAAHTIRLRKWKLKTTANHSSDFIQLKSLYNQAALTSFSEITSINRHQSDLVHNVSTSFGNISLSAGAALRHTFFTTNKQSKIRILPNVNVQTSIGKGYIDIKYSTSLEMQSYIQAINSIEIQNASSILQHNLQPSKQLFGHSLMTFAMLPRLMRGEMMYALALFTFKQQNSLNVNYGLESQIEETIIAPKQPLFLIGLHYDKQFFKQRMKIKSKLSFSSSRNYSEIADIENISQFKNITLETKVSSNKRTPYNFETRFTFRNNWIQQQQLNSTQQNVFVKTKFKHFIKKVNLKYEIGPRFVFQKNLARTNTFLMLDGKITWQLPKEPKWSAFILAQDVLNINNRTLIRTELTNSIQRQYEEEALPGFLIFGFQFEL